MLTNKQCKVQVHECASLRRWFVEACTTIIGTSRYSKNTLLALSVLKFLCKIFSKLLKLALWKTLFCGWFLKNHIFKWKICMAISLWDLWSDLSLKDASSSTDGITQNSVNYLHKRKGKYSCDLLCN